MVPLDFKPNAIADVLIFAINITADEKYVCVCPFRGVSQFVLCSACVYFFFEVLDQKKKKKLKLKSKDEK